MTSRAQQDRESIARVAVILARRRVTSTSLDRSPADDSLELHRIATRLHRADERNCNEDLTCPACGGDGFTKPPDGTSALPDQPWECRKCAGRGRTTGRAEARNEARAREIANAYNLRVYFQGDPRGCPLYLIPNEREAGQGGDACNYSITGIAVCHLG